MRRVFILLAALGVLLPSQASAETLDEARAKLAKLMKDWDQLRDQRLEVEDIVGLRGKKGDKEQLEARLETLLTKRRSNLEWTVYWEQEEAVASAVAKLYETLAPAAKADFGKGLAEGPIAGLEKAWNAKKAAVATQKTGLVQLDKDIAAAKKWLVAAAAKAPKDIGDAKKTARVGAAVTKATEALTKAKAAAASAEDEDGKAAAAKSVEAATKDLAEANKAVAERKAMQALVAAAKKAPAAVPAGLDVEAKAKVATLVNAPKRRTTIEAAQKAAEVQLGEAKTALDQARAEVARYRNRRGVLDKWEQLARAKQVNQKAYYKAIDADIKAVDQRLAGMEGQVKPGMLGKSGTICDADREKGETSLEKFYTCKKVIKQELGELEVVVGNVRAEMTLNKAQTASVAELITAQDKDKELVKEELVVADDEWARSKAPAGAETAAWTAMWSSYADRARGKQTSLATALRTSLEVQRRLTVGHGMLSSDLKNKEARRGVVTARLEESGSTGQMLWSFVKTAWEFVRQAYMVPIYLLIAWLLLRLGGRVEERVVTKARENQTDRDAVQRVETLSTVARGAFKLVIYIATVLMCLVAIDVDIGPLLGGAAIFGLAISFGSQSLVKDVVTGFFILLEDQFAVGDYISTSGVEGTVEKVTLRRTVLRDLKGAVHTVPNGSITSVSNMSQGWARVVINLGLAYGTDLDKVKEVIDRLGDEFYAEEEWAAVLFEPPRYVGMTKFDASSIVIRCMFKTEQLANYGAERAFNRLIHDTFAQEGIAIPYDTLDVNLITPEGVQAAPTS